MSLKLLSRVLLTPLILVAFNVTAENIHWKAINSPILIDADVVIPAGDTLTIDAGTEIQFSKDVVVIVKGRVEVVGQGLTTLTNSTGEKWMGLNVESDEAFVISDLHISNANIGIKLTSSPNVTVSNNLLENNGTGISLATDDGVRSNVNTIADNEIRNNSTGISASSTGADIQRNLILNNTGSGISLSGRSCGGGSTCGYRSTIQNNLISGSEIGINVYGHQLTMNNNDIYNTTIGISNRNLNNTYYNVTDNNIIGWSAFAYVNQSPDSVNSGDIWLGQPESEQSICDVKDNITRGDVTFAASNDAFPTNHNYDLPTPIESETQDSHASCPDDGYQYIATDMSWTVAESPITIEESLFIANNATLTVESGAEVLFNSGVGVTVEGSLVVTGPDYANFSAAQATQWQGVTFKRSAQEVVSKLHITGASNGIKIISSDGLTVSNNLLENNGTGISLTVDDGVRSNVNLIADNEIRNNSTGISASSTGADIRRNLILNNTGSGISLSGRSCGGGSTCGYRSTIQNNLISGSGTGVGVYGHHLTMTNNDVTSTSTAINLLNLNRGILLLHSNNVASVVDYAIKNSGALDIDFGEIWLADERVNEEVIFDFYDDNSKGIAAVTYSSDFFVNHFTLEDTDLDGLSNIQEYEIGSNPAKQDTDGDGLQDGVEIELGTSPTLGDSDFDGIGDGSDTYPVVAIGDLLDTDMDGAPNDCDEACVALGMAADTDDDNDGLADSSDAYPLVAIGELLDTDNDGAPNDCDESCVGLSMAADTDDDNDGLADTDDAFSLIAIGELLDTDMDGAPNNCDENCAALGMAADTDDDNDGITDTGDAYPLVAIGDLLDTDNDGAPNDCDESCVALGMAADTDDDNDGLADADDAYPLVAIGELLDTDMDGAPNDCDEICVALGMAADSDDDNDGVLDADDAFPLDPTRTLIVKNDVDGDGKSDLLWRSNAKGWNFLWAMDGVQTKQASPINVVQDEGWLMAGQGDYDADGKSDILWRNTLTGLNFIYLMDGLNIKARQVLNYVDAPQWELRGSGDFNGDGKGDVLWHRVDRGDTWFYMMDGLSIGTNQPSLWVTDLNYKIAAIGDINGDDTDDVIWRNQVTGVNYIWIMENGQIANRYVLNAINGDWTIAGAGDLDGDGTDDIILRNQADGRNWVYLMENGQVKTSELLSTVGSLDWQIADMGDYDGDGKADILWRNESAARNIVHLMDGLTVKDKGVLRPTDSTWQLAQ
jgi:hypothetical protein